MCDFRDPPTGVEFYDGTIKYIPFMGSVNYTTYEFDGVPRPNEVKIEGIYRTIATGSGYEYFDGNDWRREWCNHYKTGQLIKTPEHVKLLFDPNQEHKSCGGFQDIKLRT